MKKLWCWLCLLCLLMGSVTGCKGTDDGIGGGFRFPISAEPKGLDPQMATDEASVTVLCALFEGLTRPDNAGGVLPGAATWTLSEDKTVYTFTLTESFWNQNPTKGKESPWDTPLPVTADDFVFAMQRLADPAIQSPLSGELTGIQNAKAVLAGKKPVEKLGVKAVDDKTLTITLDAPDDDFLLRLSTSPFFPCHRAFFEATAGRYGLEQSYLLSNGPFRLTAWNHDESLLLYKHEAYHDAPQIAPEAVRFVIGTEDPVAALKTGDLSASPLTATQKAAIGEDLHTIALDDTVRSVWFNTSTDPLSEVHIRRALRDSIQWDSVDAYLAETSEQIAEGYIPPDGMADGAAYRGKDNPLPRKTDGKKAADNLNKGIGVLYPDGSGSAARIRVTLMAANDPVSADLARYILQSWQKHLGISATLTLVDEQELIRRVNSGDYQAALYTHTPEGLTGRENLACFGSTHSRNLSKLVSKEVDRALSAAASGDRKDLIAAEQAVWEACPAIPVSFPCRYYGFAPDTADIVARPFGGGRYQSPIDFSKAKYYD